MAIKHIITTPNKILNTPAEKVRNFDDETKKLIEDLVDTLLAAKDPEGAGLAAPQIGVLKRVCVAREFFQSPDNPDKVISREHILINPKIISTSKDVQTNWEGCLSIPDAYGKVERAEKIKVLAKDKNGERIKIKAEGFFAAVIQHEIDHLNGILFTEKMIGDLLTEKEIDKIIENI